MWFVYIISSASRGTLYTGMTNNPVERIAKHNAGKGARYTKVGAPWVLVYLEEVPTKSDALRREYAIKGLGKKAKLKLTLDYLSSHETQQGHPSLV